MAESTAPTAQDNRGIGAEADAGRGQDRLLESATKEERDRQGSDGLNEQSQRNQASQELPRKRAIYLSLLGLFVSLFVAFAAREGKGRRGTHPPIGPFDVVLLTFSTYRLSRIVSFDQITEPIRAPITDDAAGGGTKPAGSGAQKALGELITCPLCLGVWISAALTYGMLLFPKPTRVFMTIFGAAGIAEFANYVVSYVDSSNKLVQKTLKGGQGSS